MRPFAILSNVLLTLVFAFAIGMGAPYEAHATNKGPGASVGAVAAACKRTAGCWFDGRSGCSPKVCFLCDKGKCHAQINGTRPGKGATLGGIRLPPGTVKPISGNKGNVSNGKPVRHPVSVGVKNPPTNVKTNPIATWKHGGPNQSGGHHR